MVFLSGFKGGLNGFTGVLQEGFQGVYRRG